MLTIDGSSGEGGGQILRSSLALSLVTGTPFRMVNVRAGRQRPGLMRQHLASILACAQIGDAEVHGAELGSRDLTFIPGEVRAGDYHVAIGTAGSTMLVFQAVLRALLRAGGTSTLVLEGGTHARAAPPFDFVERVFVPLINRMGPKIGLRLKRHGFYPAGGGRVIATIEPAPLARLDLLERGQPTSRLATAIIAQLPGHIAERELAGVRERLGWGEDQCRVLGIRESSGPGNALLLELASEHITEMFSAFGAVGKSAESVADEAITDAREYLNSNAAVGPCLADQLLLPMALAGDGSFTTGKLTEHSTTNTEVIRQFLGTRIEAKEQDSRTVVTVGG
jgi:RNA 3'-terminal phosphate cyclase (ATP)